MPELPLVRHIRELDIIRHDVFFQSHAQRLTQSLFCIEPQRLVSRMNHHIACDAAFGIGDAGVDRVEAIGPAHIIGYLAVQVANSISTGEFPLGAVGEIHRRAVREDVLEGFRLHAGVY